MYRKRKDPGEKRIGQSREEAGEKRVGSKKGEGRT